MVDTRVTLSGWTLDNPVVAASGCFGYGREFAEWYDIGCLGTFSCKGTTLAPRVGNPTPRIAETPSGMLNAIGLQNPGVERVIAEELPALAAVFDKKIIANVGGFSTDEMAECARRLSEQPQVGLIELNVSCPNLHAGGVNFANDPKAAAAATAAVKKVSRKPVYVKLSPNVTDLTEIAKACADACASSTRCSACASTPKPAARCWQTAPAACRARRSSRSPCAPCTRSTRRSSCRSSAAAASTARPG